MSYTIHVKPFQIKNELSLQLVMLLIYSKHTSIENIRLSHCEKFIQIERRGVFCNY